MWPLVRRRWARALVVAYPFITLFCILVTGNHFWIDAIGGLVAFGTGHLLARALTSWNEHRFLRRPVTQRILGDLPIRIARHDGVDVGPGGLAHVTWRSGRRGRWWRSYTF